MAPSLRKSEKGAMLIPINVVQYATIDSFHRLTRLLQQPSLERNLNQDSMYKIQSR